MKKISIALFLIFISAFNFSAYSQATYSNPILEGFYPDPSICRVGNDYYLVNSSFSYFPGLPIFHSTDLVSWHQIGNAINRNSQLKLGKGGVSRGLFAPTIRYHAGLFYIICTNVSEGGNFIITAKNAKGPWSEPIFTPKVEGIDPSLFFDDNGKVYITYNSNPPENKSLYEGHRTIRLIEYDLQKKETIGDNSIIVNGGTDISKHPIWIEGPHLYKINDWYYLMCAEGGTAYEHSEVIFKSRNINGPYESYKSNPILTQRDLDTAGKNPITSTGHADLVETPEGKWYAVFLGCRPYAENYYNTGRETFMAPVSWKDGWPVIIPHQAAVKYHYPVPFASTKKVNNAFSGNYTFRDDFTKNNLNERFVFLRNPTNNLYNISKGFLELPLKPVAVSDQENPAFVGFRQANLKCYAAISLSFSPGQNEDKAGLLVFQNERYYYFLCKALKEGKPVVELYKSASEKNQKETLLISQGLQSNKPLRLKIQANNADYSFYYAEGNDAWKLLKNQVDGTYLSTQTAGGFVGCMFSLYATSNGSTTKNKALYNWFEYKGDGTIFKTSPK